MRRGQIFLAISLVIATCTMVFATAALAEGGTPSDICKDLADGHLDGTYTKDQLTAYLQDPTVGGYCPSIAVVVPPVAGSSSPVTPPQSGPSSQQPIVRQQPTVTKVAGVRKTVVTPATRISRSPRTSAVSPITATTKSTGTLPFTGAELALFALVGLTLIGTGLLLRTTARQRP